jgi:hypothetical protein
MTKKDRKSLGKLKIDKEQRSQMDFLEILQNRLLIPNKLYKALRILIDNYLLLLEIRKSSS